jgi:ubiquinone/menaquinone biosynthesis C-methylase UbiE
MSQYDDIATAYAVANETGLFNRWYARPELLRMAGDVAGLHVLDAGCGTGPLALDLHAAGATVSAFDQSAAMVDLARERLPDDVDLRVGDLAEPLHYADASFDLVVASLVLHYLEDWAAPLAELRRVLRPGGRLLVAIIHPMIYAIVHSDADYFVLTRYSEDYEFDGREVVLTYWHRPLHEVVNSLVAAGFGVRSLSEPPPHPDTPAELLPPGLDGRAFICFLFAELEAP